MSGKKKHRGQPGIVVTSRNMSRETTSLKQQTRRKRTYKRRAVQLTLVEGAEEGEALEVVISMSAAALFDR